MMIRYQASYKGGHTLLEMIVVITLAGIIAGITAPPLVEASKSRNRLIFRNIILSEGRFALDKMTRELREIPPKSSDATAADITTADTSRIDFQSTSYRLVSNTLKRLSESDASLYVVSGNISTFSLTYYDEDGSELSSTPLNETDRNNVRRVVVELVMSKNNETLTLRSGVYLRHFAFSS